MKTKFLAALIVVFVTGLLATAPIKAQNSEGFIYGKVYTVGGDTYEGQIRWGKEEVYWFDFFNATKPKNKYLGYLSRDEMEDLDRGNHWAERWVERMFSFSESSSRFGHTFVCQFGDIKSITVRGRNRVMLELRNGKEIRLDDGSNDVGARIRVLDSELGEVTIKWDRLDKVEFMDTPKNLRTRMGDPIYGTVYTRDGEITGYIQWDHDERLSTDKLDGDTRDDDLSIPFGKIRSIEKSGRGVELITKSGRELYLWGSNDVDRDNRGIIVNIHGMGRVDIPWREFDKVEFIDEQKDMPVYEDFAITNSISGTVIMNDGSSYTGKIVFDLDETYDFEMLNGEKDGIEYFIPFREVKQIKPKNYYFSEVVLKDGQTLLIGDSQDLSDKNYGILVFESEENYKYIPWDKVEEIVFK